MEKKKARTKHAQTEFLEEQSSQDSGCLLGRLYLYWLGGNPGSNPLTGRLYGPLHGTDGRTGLYEWGCHRGYAP